VESSEGSGEMVRRACGSATAVVVGCVALVAALLVAPLAGAQA
jgi:hypothetical protein